MKYQLRVKDEYVVEQLGINISYLEYDMDGGYLVNHRLKQITKEKRGFQKLIKNEFEYCFKEDQCTMLLKLILEEDTESTEEDIEEYEHIEQYVLIDEYIPVRNRLTPEEVKGIKKPKDRVKIGNNKYILIKYNTDEDIETVYNNYGCYAIYNTELKIIYVGETIKSFHERWNGHYTNIANDYNKRKVEMLAHPDTICTIIYISNGDKEETEYMEAQALEWYRKEYPDWTILGGTYRDNCWYKGATC